MVDGANLHRCICSMDNSYWAWDTDFTMLPSCCMDTENPCMDPTVCTATTDDGTASNPPPARRRLNTDSTDDAADWVAPDCCTDTGNPCDDMSVCTAPT